MRLERLSRSTPIGEQEQLKVPQSAPAHRKVMRNNNGHAIGGSRYTSDGTGVLVSSSSLSSVWGPRSNSADLLGNNVRQSADGKILFPRDLAGLNGIHSNCARMIEKLSPTSEKADDVPTVTLLNSSPDNGDVDTMVARESDRLLDSGVSSETSATPPSRRITPGRRSSGFPPGSPSPRVTFDSSPMGGLCVQQQRRCSSETVL